MAINKTNNLFYIVISVSVTMLLMLGCWWLYLVLQLSSKLKELNYPSIGGNLVNMIQWEGVTFFIFLMILTITLLSIYLSDHKKTRSLQAFFSSITHELKTPLASIKLQSQVLVDFIENSELPDGEKEYLLKYTSRLANDSLRLEDQLDKHLQLSRIKRGAFINLRTVNINSFLANQIKRYESLADFDLISDQKNLQIYADDFALQTIVRNLIENSIKHSNSKKLVCTFSIKPEKDSVILEYTDNGTGFSGDSKKLGKLFYKHDSPKGSGIGLYLVKKLMLQMKGNAEIKVEDSFNFRLHFLKVASDD